MYKHIKPKSSGRVKFGTVLDLVKDGRYIHRLLYLTKLPSSVQDRLGLIGGSGKFDVPQK